MIYFVDSYVIDVEKTRHNLISDQIDKCLLSPFSPSRFNQCHQEKRAIFTPSSLHRVLTDFSGIRGF